MTEYQITTKQMQILRFLYMYFNDDFQNSTKQLHKTKQKYSLIFDKSFIKPRTHKVLRWEWISLNVSGLAQACWHRQEKFLTSRAFTIENILKILKLTHTEIILFSLFGMFGI